MKQKPPYKSTDMIATREAYGDALVALGKTIPELVVLDGEMANSLFEENFARAFPDRYFEMFIAEQNMVSVAVGLSKTGFIPVAASFGSFLSRAFDQIRMAQYSNANIKLAGSHVGVSVGQDGSSQMALEDIAMIRSVLNSYIFYPSDAISSFKLTEQLIRNQGVGYLRLTREKFPIIYGNDEEFVMGGSKVLRESKKDTAVIFAAGITVHEALKAYEELKKQNIQVAVVDLYSVKPLDTETIRTFAQRTKNVIVVEDHYPAGGIGEAVAHTLMTNYELQITNKNGLKTRHSSLVTPNFTHLYVHKIPHSGSPAELAAYEEINAEAIIKAVKELG